ncbi:MAG: tetratricopeptide repeat protein [Gemmatimonadales bacterium]|jgi:tetratricopeptide (TPR) repeat protein
MTAQTPGPDAAGAGGQQTYDQMWATMVAHAEREGKPGDIHGVIQLLRERVANKPDFAPADLRQVGVILTQLGGVHHRKRDADSMTAAFDEADRIFRELGETQSLIDSLRLKAGALREQGRLDDALEAYRQQETLCREHEDTANLQRALSGQASVLMDRGDADRAMPLLAEQARICRELGDKHALLDCLSTQVKMLHLHGDAEHAAELAAQQEELARELEDTDTVAQTLCNRGLLLLAQNQLDEAAPLLEQAEGLLRQGGDRRALANTIGSRAVLLMTQGDLPAALELQREAADLCRQEGDGEGLAKALTMQASILGMQGDARAALPLVQEAHTIASQLGLQAMVKEMIQPILDQVSAAAPPSPEPGPGRAAGPEEALGAAGEQRMAEVAPGAPAPDLMPPGDTDLAGIQDDMIAATQMLFDGRRDEALALLEDLYGRAQRAGLHGFAEGTIRPTLEQLRGVMQGGAEDEEGRRMLADYEDYSRRLAEYRSLPFFKRLRTKRPRLRRE